MLDECLYASVQWTPSTGELVTDVYNMKISRRHKDYKALFSKRSF